jgi:hypothetical protein
VIGREIGFGRGSLPGAPPIGTALRPFLFEGVAQYSLFDGAGQTLGAVTTNVLEGRRFDMQLAEAPGVQAHVVTHLYAARLNDPEGKFRAAVNLRSERG